MSGDLIGYEQQRGWFRNAIATGRLTSSFLFVGPPNIGKRTFARYLAKSLLCERVPAAELAPCGVCSHCIQVAADTHPDILQVSKPDDRATIPVELLIGRREARMQEGLCHDIRLKPMAGGRRIAILDDCDVLNQEGANSLLKTLEEPPPHALMVLIGTSAQRQLPTIRSRCQIIRFASPPRADAEQILLRRAGELELEPAAISAALDAVGGDLSRAIAFLSEEFREFTELFTKHLLEQPPEAIATARVVTQFVEAAGTEAPLRRARLSEVGSLAAEIFRRRLRTAAEVNQLGNTQVQRDLFRMERSLELVRHVDRFANQATMIEAWAADLQRGAAAG
ncbi:ATP-binding protein [Planctomycetaceae bacterium SH139]